MGRIRNLAEKLFPAALLVKLPRWGKLGGGGLGAKDERREESQREGEKGRDFAGYWGSAKSVQFPVAFQLFLRVGQSSFKSLRRAGSFTITTFWAGSMPVTTT